MFMIVVFDNNMIEVMINGESQQVELWDTAGNGQNGNILWIGQEAYEHLLRLSYPNTDIFLICYSVVE